MVTIKQAKLNDLKGMEGRENALGGPCFSLSALEMFMKVTGYSSLLEDNPLLARSVDMRFPYLMPLNAIQLEMLRRYRAGDARDKVRRGIQLTMNGLATALRNSG